MGEADPIAFGLDDASLESRYEARGSPHAGCRLGDRDRRMGMGGGGGQEVQALGRERKQTTVDEVVEGVGHGRGLPAAADMPERVSVRTISSA